MTSIVLIDARFAARGLGIATFLERLEPPLQKIPGLTVRRWGGATRRPAADFAAHSGPFDLSPRLDPRARADVVHYASNVASLLPGPHSVVTVHDLLYRIRGRPRDRLFGALLERGVRRAGCVVAISERTKADLVARIGQTLEITVIPHGMRPRPLSIAPRTHVLAFGGGADPRKRVDLAIAAYRAYRRRSRDPMPLVVLGRAGLTEAQRAALVDVRAEIVTSAERADVDGLLGGAAAVLYTSMAEGFGLPVVEAAEHAVPVVVDGAADIAEEVRGRHCRSVSGTDPERWADVLEEAIDGGPVPNALDLPTWDEVAARYHELYRRVASR